MGAKTNLGKFDGMNVASELDSVVIRHYGSGITGGRSLDMTGFTGTAIKAGHLVIKVLDEDGKNYTFKPMPVADDGIHYASLPANHSYAGVVVASKPADEAMVGIMDDGRVNDEAMPYQFADATQRAAVLAALPNLIFEHD